MIDDRIIGPYFTLEHAATNSYCFIFIGRITNMCQPVERGLGADIRGGGAGGGEGSDRGGADKTTVLCKPRYQCGVNRALTPSAGNQPLPLSSFDVLGFCRPVVGRARHTPV